ncbi:hypothetical protein [Halorussus halophilus]|uniref:hypothetical protein n=1 Tax=Halorussus halophilus TaxID=2650975 RepID=UPI001300E427|nr:hypothetical protein [Halorussus halophilus]
MTEEVEERVLRVRVPVSEGYWRDYGAPLALLLAVLLGLAFLLGGLSTDAFLVGVLFVGLSLSAIVAGLIAYNVAVMALLAARR